MNSRSLCLLTLLLTAVPALAQTGTPTPTSPVATATPVVLPGAPTASPSPAAPVLTSTASKGPVTGALQLDRDKVEVGQSVRVTLDLHYPGNLSLTPPPADKFDFKPFDVQDSRLTTLPPEQGMQHLRYSFKLAPFDFGVLKIPSQTIPFQLNGHPDSLTLAGPSVEVQRITPGKDDKPDQIRDLKALETAPFPRPLLYALIAAGLLLSYALYRLIVWLRRPRFKKAAPAMLPYPFAQQELSRLERERPDQEGRYEEFYERLTLILRTYLGWRYGRSLLEQTTSETLDSLAPPSHWSGSTFFGAAQAAQLKGGPSHSSVGLTEPHWNELRTVLEQADLVKFARITPSAERTDEHLRIARNLIENNAPFEEHPAQAGRTGGHHR